MLDQQIPQQPTRERRSAKDLPHEVTLRLHDIHDLFALPRHNAFHENYLPLSGVDQIALQLKYARLRNGVHVTLILPEGTNQEPNLHAEVQTAIHRYCNTRIHNLMYELKARQLTVIRSLQVGVMVLGISLALAAAVSRTEFLVDWLRNLLSNSISIFGTVALWTPADAFLFGMRPLYNDIHICQAIAEMTFDIQYEKFDPTVVPDQSIYRRGRR